MPTPTSHAPLPITGCSMISALGVGLEATWQAIRAGRSGLGAPPSWFPHPTFAGRVQEELAPCPAPFEVFDCRQAQLALAVLEGIANPLDRAIRRWGADRVALIIGTSTGGIDRTEAALEEHRATSRMPAGYSMAKKHNFHAFCELIKHVSGTRGPAYIISTACSSSAKVFASACRMIEAELADAVVVGGVDTLCKTTLYGFHSLGILADERCRPFGAQRKGINLGEGGALMLLERHGEAPAMFLGAGESSDGHHMTTPHPQGKGAVLAMQRALNHAGLSTEAVDFINAHGTGTTYNDRSEAVATASVFGTETPVVSTKGFTGHTLGAAGGIEAALCYLSLLNGYLPASLGADPVDPDIDVAVNLEGRTLPARVALSNSFGFGGNNASLLFGVAT